MPLDDSHKVGILTVIDEPVLDNEEENAADGTPKS